MARPQPERRAETRRRLLGAAASAFARSGYERATAEGLARAAGLSKGAFYFHFAAKEDALRALAEEWISGRTQRLRAAVESGQPPAARLLDALEALLIYEPQDRLQPRLLLDVWSYATRDPALALMLKEAYGHWRAMLAGAFEQAQRAGVLPARLAPPQAASLVLALHDGLAAQAGLPGIAGRSFPTRRMVGDVFAFVAGGERGVRRAASRRRGRGIVAA